MADHQSSYAFVESFRKDKNRQPSFRDFSLYLENKARQQGVPLTGLFELTPLCNLDCRMCYVHLNAEQLRDRSVLKPDVWKSLMSQALDAGMMHAVLTGGECLAYPGFEEVYLHLHEHSCEVELLTNGVLLDEKRLEFLLKHRPTGIQITLYGCSEDVYERVTGHRVFTLVTDNIRRIMDAGLNLELMVTPSVHLGEDVLETYQLARELCPSVALNKYLYPPREDTGRSERQDNPDMDLIVRLYQLQSKLDGKTIRLIPEEQLPEPGGPPPDHPPKGLYCSAGRSCFSIDWEGFLYPCNHLRMIRENPLRDGFPAAWKSVNKQAENWKRELACETCPYLSVCNPCAATVRQHACPGSKPETWCKRTITLVRYGILNPPDC